MDRFARDIRWGAALTGARILRWAAGFAVLAGVIATVLEAVNLHDDFAGAPAIAAGVVVGLVATTLVWGLLATAGWALPVVVDIAEHTRDVRESLSTGRTDGATGL